MRILKQGLLAMVMTLAAVCAGMTVAVPQALADWAYDKCYNAEYAETDYTRQSIQPVGPFVAIGSNDHADEDDYTVNWSWTAAASVTTEAGAGVDIGTIVSISAKVSLAIPSNR